MDALKSLLVFTIASVQLPPASMAAYHFAIIMVHLCLQTRLKIVQHGTGMIDFCYNDVCLGVGEPPWPIFVTVTPHHRGFHPLEHQYNEGYI